MVKRITTKRTRATAAKNPTERVILTIYYNGTEVVKQNRAMFANRAVPKAVDHMQFNTYGATHAEVYDEDCGILHASIIRDIAGAKDKPRMGIAWQRKIKETYTAAARRGNGKISKRG